MVDEPINPAQTSVAPASSAPNPATADAPAPTPNNDAPAPNDVIVAPTSNDANSASPAKVSNADTPAEVARKINEAHNVLIALSSDPSVDELAAAIGISIHLDKMGKRATAIYSGSTPNALEFLNPEETFEATADTLQDFVIALDKEKADHLRYKLDGDYVKIYITPYRHRLSEDDLDFSYGDYNVDLVLALDVANGIDLDAALREHGRIMHDASIINITTGNPGKFGEIEWGDKKSSSVSEMIARLLYSMSGKIKIEKEEATAFLTGIVAATNRFSNAVTTPETLRLAARLIESGANQQLVSKNITPDTDNELFSLSAVDAANDFNLDEKNGDSEDGSSNNSGKKNKKADPTKLDIGHGDEEGDDENFEVNDTITEKESTLLDDLKAAEESLAHAGTESLPDNSNQPVRLDTSTPADEPAPSSLDITLPEPPSDDELATSPTLPPVEAPVEASAEQPSPSSEPPAPSLPLVEAPVTPSFEPVSPASESDSSNSASTAPSPNGFPGQGSSEKIITPTGDFTPDSLDDGENKYGKMLEDALATSANANPALVNAPSVPANPGINGVPSINYMPMPGEEVLPPPPAPPIDMSTPANTFTPAAAGTMAAESVVNLISPDTPQMSDFNPIQTPPTAPSTSPDPGSFQIPTSMI